jgi:hypothetical protein
MIIGVTFCGCQAAKVTIYSEDEIGVKRRIHGNGLSHRPQAQRWHKFGGKI